MKGYLLNRQGEYRNLFKRYFMYGKQRQDAKVSGGRLFCMAASFPAAGLYEKSLN